MLQPINNARTLSGPGFQDLDIWLSGPGFQDLNARFQDLGFRPSTRGFRTSKALHPTVVLSFSRHFSLRPPSLFFFPSLFSASTVTFLFPVTFLCVQWSTVMADDEAKEEESERRTGLCILIHRQNWFCHRKCRPVPPVN